MHMCVDVHTHVCICMFTCGWVGTMGASVNVGAGKRGRPWIASSIVLALFTEAASLAKSGALCASSASHLALQLPASAYVDWCYTWPACSPGIYMVPVI